MSFEELLFVDDILLQRILSECSLKEIALALKGASPDMHKKLEQNLSKAAYTEYKNISHLLGSVPITEVESAQQKCIMVYEQQKTEKA